MTTLQGVNEATGQVHCLPMTGKNNFFHILPPDLLLSSQPQCIVHKGEMLDKQDPGRLLKHTLKNN